MVLRTSYMGYTYCWTQYKYNAACDFDQKSHSATCGLFNGELYRRVVVRFSGFPRPFIVVSAHPLIIVRVHLWLVAVRTPLSLNNKLHTRHTDRCTLNTQNTQHKQTTHTTHRQIHITHTKYTTHTNYTHDTPTDAHYTHDTPTGAHYTHQIHDTHKLHTRHPPLYDCTCSTPSRTSTPTSARLHLQYPLRFVPVTLEDSHHHIKQIFTRKTYKSVVCLYGEKKYALAVNQIYYVLVRKWWT